MFARYAGMIGVGHNAQYNLQLPNTSPATTPNKPLTANDELDLSDDNKDMSETDEGGVGEGLRNEEEGDDEGNDDKVEESDNDNKVEESDSNDKAEGDDDDDDEGCCGCGFKF